MITHWQFWAVLAASVPVFWLLPARFRLGFLALVSFLYLLILAPASVLALAAFGLGIYYLLPATAGRAWSAWVPRGFVLGVLGYLAYFKYLPRLFAEFASEPVIGRLVVPLGISYFSFKLIHYAIERARGRFGSHSVGDFLAYLFLFPIFTAGPIERFEHFLGYREQHWTSASAVEGGTRIAHGLIKKFVIAQWLVLPLMDGTTDGAALLRDLPQMNAGEVWAYCVLSFLYLYLDFSAYSDIAIGASRLFGLRIMENFNWPILASNIGMFWKRWHMTLAGWCQSYVYMPLIGLTRNPYVATLGSFAAIGLWHSGSLGWVLWGLYHGLGVVAFGYWSGLRRRRKWRGLDRPGWRWAGVPATIAFVSVGTVFSTLDGVGGGADMARVLARLIFVAPGSGL